VADVLTSTALPAPRLCLEVTESALIRDLDQAVRVLKQFKQSGVSLSLDDLGTGYSSLSYLKRLAVDSLKIDKSFVDDLATDDDSVTFINSIWSLGGALNLDVVAEGVESQDQAEILTGLGCERAQGDLFTSRCRHLRFAPCLKNNRTTTRRSDPPRAAATHSGLQ
jgi:EAL domain-containing protein (putative c-di-GMP-specific phosphodiesterase class I)